MSKMPAAVGKVLLFSEMIFEFCRDTVFFFSGRRLAQFFHVKNLVSTDKDHLFSSVKRKP